MSPLECVNYLKKTPILFSDAKQISDIFTFIDLEDVNDKFTLVPRSVVLIQDGFTVVFKNRVGFTELFSVYKNELVQTQELVKWLRKAKEDLI